MEEAALRVSQQMSPKRSSYPTCIKSWEDTLRSPRPRISFSDYYIINSPAASTKRTNSSSKNPFVFSPTVRSSPLKIMHAPASLFKSELQTTAASKSFALGKSRYSHDDYLSKVMELENENQKFIELCNSEIRRHQLEKKTWTETVQKIKSAAGNGTNKKKPDEVKNDSYSLQEEFNRYRESKEKEIKELKEEITRLNIKIKEMEESAKNEKL